MKVFRTYDDLPHPNKVKKYRKKTTIQAVQVEKDCMIYTIEGGLVKCRAGDYIAKGAKGELYPIADEIMKITYEEIQ
jgi:hypothetical protein